jgi:peptide-methionine (S)-S-oxide reductase
MQPDKSTSPDATTHLETATLGAGCFWCVEAIFQDLKGVVRVESGYAGGQVDNPTYEAVCSGRTGHAEVIDVHFDPAVISYREILEVFFKTHDPTTLNRQGADSGTQYRSAIFYHSPEQKATAEAVKETAAAWWNDPIVTEITPLEKFYPAEKYHQNYYRNNPYNSYCSFVIAPKLRKLRENHREMIRS